MSIVFIGTPEFAVPSLRRLHAAGHVISAVISQPDRPAGRGRKLTPPPVKLAAEEMRLPVRQPETLRDPEVLAWLRSLAPEAIVAVAYGQILRQELLDIPPKGVLNVHPSLLPRHRGASPIAGAILAGDEETGVTIMLMDAGMDSGPILSQRTVPLSPHDTTGSLTESLAELGADLLAKTLTRHLAGEIEPTPQDDSAATVTHLVKKEDGAIDWTLPATGIWRRVRACNPWPGAYAALDGDHITIWQAWPLSDATTDPPGTIMELPASAPSEASNAAFAIATGEGLLAVLELQRSGRRPLSSQEFARGMTDLIGQRFETP